MMPLPHVEAASALRYAALVMTFRIVYYSTMAAETLLISTGSNRHETPRDDYEAKALFWDD